MTTCRAPTCDSCDQARDRIEEVLTAHQLEYDIYVGCAVEGGTMDLHVTVPGQQGLATDMKISFQNTDELWLNLYGFAFQKYPSSSLAGENFFRGLEAFLTGKARIIERVGKSSGVTRIARWETPKTRSSLPQTAQDWTPLAVDVKSWRALSFTPYIDYVYTNKIQREVLE